MNDHAFNDLLAGYLDGKLEEREIEQLLAAVNSSQELRQKFQEETRLHVLLRESMSEQVEINLIQESVTPRSAPTLRWFGWLAFANAAVLLIASAWYFVRSGDQQHVGDNTKNDAPSFGVCLNVSGSLEVEIERSSGKQSLAPDTHLRVGDRVTCGQHARAMLQLADGSILSLDKGAQLTLVSDQPEIRLEHGEVLFEIAKRKPDALAFRVHTSQSTVDVMGTVFGLSDDGQTKLEVYEGRVSMTRHSDSKRVEVGSQQTVSTQDRDFAAQTIGTSTRKTVNILSSQNATLDNGKLEPDQHHLKVEANKRIAYLRFEIPEFEDLESAILQLTQEIDTGSGKLQIHIGEHSDWNESNLAQHNAPKPLQKIAERRGVVTNGQVIELDVTATVTQPGPITLILTLNKSGENDIWFGARKSQHPPELVLTSSETPR